MSLSDWTAIISAKASQKCVSESSVAFTLNDWINKRRDDFKPEKRIQGFIKQAEESLYGCNYEDAIALYSNAIDLNPIESHLYTNRSLCFLKTKQYELCLTDAQKAIELSDESLPKRQKMCSDPQRAANLPKFRNKLMYYLKARALREMKRFQESIDALVLSKSLAIECHFIDKEIKDIKLEVICDLGYDRPDVEKVCNQLDSIEELIKLLIQSKQLLANNDNTDQLPSNPFKYRGLYVNGLSADLKETHLEELLSSCGQILRCKVYSNRDQSRAIIAFSDDQSVRKAIQIIRSQKEIVRDQSVDNLVFRYRHNCVDDESDLRADPQIHFKGTEIGGECFKWRTTGCDDINCKSLHIPICHNLDQQSVETKSVEKKRQPIVFHNSSKTKVSPNTDQKLDPRLKLKENKLIESETNKTQSLDTPKTTSKRTRIVFDIDNESQDKDSDKRLDSSNRKVIRLKTNSKKNDLNSATDLSQNNNRSERKRIVFDLIDIDRPNSPVMNSDEVKPLKSENSLLFKTPTIPSGRNVASYDDLF